MERNSTLRTKSILAEISPDDGLRISIMSRHTLPDGITPDERITDDKFDLHMTQLAPPLKVVGAYYRAGATDEAWDAFENRFKEHLKNPETREALLRVIQFVAQENVTLLCIEETPEHCHRRLVAEECQRLDPTLLLQLH